MSSPRLILAVDTEFFDGLRFLCGDGLLADVKRQLVPVALDLIRSSLLLQTHPLEALQSLGDMHWEDLVENPHTSSVINRLLDEIELHPRLQGVVGALRQPLVMQRMRIEWLHEMTVGRFEHSIPFLHKEEELLKGWEQFCRELRESSINPFDAADQEAQQFLSSHGDNLSDSARRLYRLSFLATCRKLFVYFSGAKETWAGSYTFHSFKLSGSLADQLGRAARDAQVRGGHLSLRFGQVDHVFYLKPTLEQLQLYLECIRHPELTAVVQRKLCPFVSRHSDELNFLAEVFYRIYLPGRLREIHHPPQVGMDETFLQESGMKRDFFWRFRFLALGPEMVGFLSEKMEGLPRLRAFLHHARTESGLVRQRLYRGILDPMLTDVAQKTLYSLCRQWNPLLRTEGGATLLLMNYVEGKASCLSGDDPKATLLRERVILEELLKILDRNTQSWQEALAKDAFMVDRARTYFMTVLDKAIEECGSEETRCTRYRDSRRVACVVVE
jgi:hypothetical protein